MVEGRWNPDTTSLFSETQKALLQEKLAGRRTADGWVLIKSQAFRSQLENKQEVVRKFSQLVADALRKKVVRIATRPSKAVAERRIEKKKQQTEKKQARQKLRPGQY